MTPTIVSRLSILYVLRANDDQRRKKRYFWACVLFAFVAVFASLFLTVSAFAEQPTQTKTTVKVAYYPLDGFFEYDEDGSPCGYGVDYLNELKKYANIEWEYVPVDSWEGIKPLLNSGEVDAYMPVSEPSSPSELYDFSTEPILISYHAIMTLCSREDLYYQDYDTISHIKIAVCENTFEKTGMKSYLQSIGAVDNLVYYPDYNSCRAALDSGTVDALISNVMDLTDDMKIIDKFSGLENFIAMPKGNPCFTVVNDAMTQLMFNDPTFQSLLYEKYFPERAYEPYTKEESEYIAATPTLTVAVYSDRKPVSYIDENGHFHGIAIELANLISERIGIPFTYIAVDTDTQEEMLDRADLVMPVPDTLDSDDYFVTQSVLDTEILMAVRSGETELNDRSRVGVLSTTPGILGTLKDQGDYDLVLYETSRDACNALQRGEIDAFANSSHVIDWLLQNPRYADLVVLRHESLPLAFSLCGNADATVLQSILGKAILTITDSEQNDIVKNGVKLEMDDFTLEDRFYIYRLQLLGLGVILLMLVLFVILFTRTRSRYYRQIEESSKRLEDANIAKSEFLSRMSHDMRTPMNEIIGITNLLRDRTDPKEMKEDIVQIEMSAQYLLNLINDTLDMGRIEAGKMELHPAPISSEDLFKNIISMSNILAQQKDIHLEMEFPSIAHGGWVPVIADAARVEQVFINIISNAIKFTPSGGTVTLCVDTIAITDTTVQDHCTVSDTGIGMTEEFQKHLFEPFAQEGRAKNTIDNGTGLGLAIVKQIIDLMGGSISVVSQEDKGTTFTIELSYPRYLGDVLQNSAQQIDLSILSGKRILLFEDQLVNASIAIRLLESKQMIVECAENGAVGVEMFARSAENYYDAILMDIRMPVMDGIDATKAIRAMTDRKDAGDIPIIAMTANAFDGDREQTRAAGMDMHLAKPIEPAQLFNALATCLSKPETSVI